MPDGTLPTPGRLESVRHRGRRPRRHRGRPARPACLPRRARHRRRRQPGAGRGPLRQPRRAVPADAAGSLALADSRVADALRPTHVRRQPGSPECGSAVADHTTAAPDGRGPAGGGDPAAGRGSGGRRLARVGITIAAATRWVRPRTSLEAVVASTSTSGTSETAVSAAVATTKLWTWVAGPGREDPGDHDADDRGDQRHLGEAGQRDLLALDGDGDVGGRERPRRRWSSRRRRRGRPGDPASTATGGRWWTG